jgi:hypothetical protein
VFLLNSYIIAKYKHFVNDLSFLRRQESRKNWVDPSLRWDDGCGGNKKNASRKGRSFGLAAIALATAG